MRSRHVSIRGRIGLIEKGSGTLVGEIDLVDSIGPLSRDDLATGTQNHQITESRLPSSEWMHRWNHARVMAAPTRYQNPVPYTHPSGAVTWVNLEKQLGG